jgi:hypothetical protein
VHHKHTAKVAAHARVVSLHAQKLLKLQREIEREAAAIAGAAYKEYHDVGYDEYGSMESQRAIDDGAIRGQGLVDVVMLASSITTYATRVAGAAISPHAALRVMLGAPNSSNQKKMLITLEVPPSCVERAHRIIYVTYHNIIA